ncbi:MAG: SAM-dependent methyltransferase, partial [Betaproteobacteria bacterium]|nr:SAM-dependent methyltransferase [Betaproteobacteria bacterium]
MSAFAVVDPELSDRDFQEFRRLIHELSGIYLADSKR